MDSKIGLVLGALVLIGMGWALVYLLSLLF
jgi:hypothetical protein